MSKEYSEAVAPQWVQMRRGFSSPTVSSSAGVSLLTCEEERARKIMEDS